MDTRIQIEKVTATTDPRKFLKTGSNKWYRKYPTIEMFTIVAETLHKPYLRWINGYPLPFHSTDPKTMRELYDVEIKFREYTSQLDSEYQKGLNTPEPVPEAMINRLTLLRKGEMWRNPSHYRKILTWNVERKKLVEEFERPLDPIPSSGRDRDPADKGKSLPATSPTPPCPTQFKIVVGVIVFWYILSYSSGCVRLFYEPKQNPREYTD